MWSRAELKSRAKDCLRRYYWAALAVTFLVGILGGGNGGGGYGSSGASVGQQINQTKHQTQYYGGGMGGGMSSSDWALFAGVMTVVIAVFLVIMAVAMLFRIFVGNVMTVGGNRYFMESRAVGRSAGVGKIFYGFGSGSYLNIVKTQFLKDLFISLWSLLLIVPGVIKAYQYYMVPYILSENPDMRYRDALDLSRQMMDGHKWDTFVLELSFIGWYLLGLICCCIGVIFVEPYVQATMAELYAVLRENVGYTGLRGFGGEDEYYDNVVSEQ
ncbi:MAG: DUF975 family protein [Hungatella hathewayi]|mgnify:CR=1 FL=1|uniref:DUF975 family protein n=1 Tax=Hungatella hathewayi WAL-18680 TaxID=742737 RepID=G5IDC0_9FIRM|nr:DUF975 family protein [Hungatella hathewayi]EHI60502.1 hypothetical protein HMPREF9473_01497 [ [Hungatella hathewayi WAL-18680]MBS4983387.1 DUF975 family protein [Hungatella hathewayi]